MEVDFLSSAMRTSQAFVQDLKTFLSIDSKKYQALRDLVGSTLEELDEKRVDQAQSILDANRSRALHIIYMMQFLLGRITETRVPMDKVLSELQAVAEIKLSDEALAELSRALQPTQAEISSADGSNAFAFGDTYIASQLTPIFAYGTGESSSRLFPGFSWTLNYRRASGTTSAFSVTLSTYEARDLAKKLIEAAEDAERKLELLGGTR
jgi:hypothetical protein